jgi:uncharacterized protein (TIGR03067 family)
MCKTLGRFLVFCTLIAVCLWCQTVSVVHAQNDADKGIKELQGKWREVERQTAGISTPKEVAEKARLEVNDDEWIWLSGGPVDVKSRIRLDPSKSPKEIDITMLDGPGKGSTAQSEAFASFVERWHDLCLRQRKWATVVTSHTLTSMQFNVSHKRIVLAVDDEPAIRTLLMFGLPSGGFEVIVASSGSEAIELFKRREDDIGVILLDVCMQGAEWVETGRILRELDPEVPLCFMTGYHSEEVGNQVGQFHAPVLQKPLSLAALFCVLTRLINSRDLASAL